MTLADHIRREIGKLEESNRYYKGVIAVNEKSIAYYRDRLVEEDQKEQKKL